MSSVFVTGGSGFIGGVLIRRLVADGHTVRDLARSAAARAKVAELGAQPVPGDRYRDGGRAPQDGVGRGDTNALPGMIEAVESGKFAWIGGGRHLTDTTHVDNVVHA